MEIQDKEELSRLFANVLNQIVAMQSRLNEYTVDPTLTEFSVPEFSVPEVWIQYYEFMIKHGLPDSFEEMLSSIRSWDLRDELFADYRSRYEKVKKENDFKR